ncbi:MAG: hypothetical protein B7Y36_12185 [Novosphingobium sp. 28-62-57]|nr:MAG: hypothetical protein B7Y36_12185 [Novosphingobium sp. 28-62-57]OZA36821.1 MAG: hypothetical protein B7X92_05490 [Novosphingobium sp. 17-62-9]
MMTRTLTLLACALLAGCGVQGPENASLPPPMPEPAEAVAQLLVEAQGLQDQPKRLGTTLARLDALGARPLDAGADPVAQWRARAEMPKTPPYRGRVLGPAYKAGMLNPGDTVRLPQLFDGGRAARVAVATADKAPLDFTVLDREAKPVCPPAKARSKECSWTPLFSGRFEIVLSNSSANAAGYYLVID